MPLTFKKLRLLTDLNDFLHTFYFFYFKLLINLGFLLFLFYFNFSKHGVLAVTLHAQNI